MSNQVTSLPSRFCRMAIIDDVSEDRRYLEKLIQTILPSISMPVQAEIHSYASGEAFLFDYEEVESGAAPDYDILFLDIEMPGLSGVSLAKKIREKNETIQIVFVTGYSEYIEEGYEVSALHYLMKPIRTEKLKNVLEKALRLIDKNEKAILVRTESSLKRILLHEIRYMDVHGNYVTIHAKENVDLKRTLSSLQEELDERFYRVGRSLIINLACVRNVTRKEVFLLDGERLALPRGAYNDLVQAIIHRL